MFAPQHVTTLTPTGMNSHTVAPAPEAQPEFIVTGTAEVSCSADVVRARTYPDNSSDNDAGPHLQRSQTSTGFVSAVPWSGSPLYMPPGASATGTPLMYVPYIVTGLQASQVDSATSATIGIPHCQSGRLVDGVWTDRPKEGQWLVPTELPKKVCFMLNGKPFKMRLKSGVVSLDKIGKWSFCKRALKSIDGIQVMFAGLNRHVKDSGPKDSGSAVVSNALSGVYGERACEAMLTWVMRGAVKLCAGCTLACIMPNTSMDGEHAVNQRLPASICSNFTFGRLNDDLYWIPGEGLPCYKVKRANGDCFTVHRSGPIPEGLELCSAVINGGFGSM